MIHDIAKMRKVLHSSAINYDSAGHLVTFDAELSWISQGKEKEWLEIDLGKDSMLESIQILWGEGYARSFEVEVSDDAACWTELAKGQIAEDAPASASEYESASESIESKLVLQGHGRYIRLLLSDCAADHFEIRKVHIFGDNDLTYALPQLPEPLADGKQILSGGSWEVKRASEVAQDGFALSAAPGGTQDDAVSAAACSVDDALSAFWLPAVVPGTVLTSYLEAGALADPFYDDDQFQASEAYFTADFWYRNHFIIPEEKRGQRVFLNFESINWKADIFLNGKFLPNELPERSHSLEGAFIRGKFDITDIAGFGKENYLAVRIFKNETPGEVTSQGLAFGPGPNGGKLGADNPTLHAAVGWDWLPTIRGRSIGIIGEVSLTYSREAVLVDPWMETGLELKKETTQLPMKDLMLTARTGQVCEWHGTEGSSFTVDLGQEELIGAVTAEWGTEAGGAAADFESRYPEAFCLEVSCDGENWQNLDAYPGGEVNVVHYGPAQAQPHKGTDVLEGHSISDTLKGATAIALLENRHGQGTQQREIVDPQKARFLRFTVLKQRRLNGRAVDTIIRTLHIYQESPEQLEQGVKHTYELDTSKADLTFRTEVRNLTESTVKTQILGRILPDGIEFAWEGEIAAETTRAVEIPVVLPAPKLWWPNTYGDQYLYDAEITLLVNDAVSEKKNFRFGVRRFDYPIEGGLLTLYCNGVRIVAKGGNWGIDDGLKRDQAQSLDDKVRLHAEANMNMIRNWVGMTSHPAFYEACDKYGVLIWDDFWLANPVDGPDPNDEALFLENAADKIRAVRSHAALTFYCGRNEGNPPETIDRGLAALTAQLDGTRIYFPHSAAAPVGSGGGYSLARPGEKYGIKQYFNDVTSSVLRSERGIPNVPELSSVKRFVRPEHLWPISETWALHDWTYHMNGPANTYMEALKNYIGGDFEVPVDHVQGQKPSEEDPVFIAYKAAIAKMCREAAEAWTAEDFFRAVQLISYDHHRGMFDALGSKLSNGLLMWMSQSSWPSFMWQTYDYYLDVNGGYFGAKAGNQPTRAIFDPRNNTVLAVNASGNTYENVTVTSELFELTGKKADEKTYELPLLEADAYAVLLGQMDFAPSETDVVFFRLTLADAAGKILGTNLYWHNRKEYQNYKALNTLPKASVCVTEQSREILDGAVRCTLRVVNGDSPALGVRVRPCDESLLPVFYSDNYLMMMPGEERLITAEFRTAEPEQKIVWKQTGWNL